MPTEIPPTRTLSTGHEVDLPLSVTCTVGGAVVPARRSGLARLLPDGLSPVPIGPRIGSVVLAGIQYHRVGGGGGDAFDPYDEFAVIVPAVPAGEGGPARSLRRLLGGDVGGYVHWLPVTTDASVALGRELWGYPKERADVTVTDGPESLRASVTVAKGGPAPDGRPSGRRERDRVLTLEVPKRRGRTRSLAAHSFTRPADDVDPEASAGAGVVRTRIEFEGAIGVGTGLGASVSLGTGPIATGLRDAGVREWPLATVYGSRIEGWLFPGESLASADAAQTTRHRATADGG